MFYLMFKFIYLFLKIYIVKIIFFFSKMTNQKEQFKDS
jgi:hypothetical protein